MRRALAGLTLLLLLAPAAAAQQDPRLERLDAPTRLAVARLIDSLRATGVPAEPLIDKALEGATKAAPGPRIVDAVRAWGRDLARVAAVLGPTPSDATLVAGAAAYRSGVALAALSALAAVRPRGELLVPLAVLSDLAASGMAPDSAAAAVIDVARRGGKDADFQGLKRGLERGNGRGRGPSPDLRPGRANGRGTGGGPPITPPGKANGRGNGNGNGNGRGKP